MNYVQGVLIGGVADGRRVSMLDAKYLTVTGLLQAHAVAPNHVVTAPTHIDAHHYEVFWGCRGIRFLRPRGWSDAQAFEQLAKGYGPEVVR